MSSFVRRGLGMLLALLVGAPAAASALTCAEVQPLRLGDSVMTLPSGTVGQPYRYTLRATGGVPPYTYRSESLPPGMSLSAAGELAGAPATLPMVAVFVAGVRDRHGCIAQQTYRLAIMAPRPAPPPRTEPRPRPPRPAEPAKKPEETPPPPKPLPPQPLTTVPLIETLAAPSSPQSTMDVYRLTPDIFKDKDVLADLKRRSADVTEVAGLIPAAEPEPADEKEEGADGGTAKDEGKAEGKSVPRNEFVDPTVDVDAKAQFQRMLAPLVGVEFPGRDLFVAALDTRLCAFSREMIVAAANRQHQPPPVMKDSDCPPDWSKVASADDSVPPSHLPWQQVPQWLMSASMHALLIEKAKQSHSLIQPAAPSWSGAGCGCVRALSGQVYGFYPYWDNGAAPRRLDFSMLSRISVFALWFADNGDLMEPGWTTAQDTAFIREAQRQKTALDYTLYHNDWRFLQDATDDNVRDIAERLAVQATNFIDTPLSDLASRVHAWVPGFARVERYGNGLTLYLDRMPGADDPLRPAFERYLNQQVRGLVAELRRRQRAYVLNIVLRDTDLTGTGAIWTPSRMAEYLGQAEALDPRGGKVPGGNAREQSGTNLSLRYMVLLTQPSANSMREILVTIDRDKDISEEMCRILLRRVIPIVSTGASTGEDLTEDLSYASDNFGGAGFWAAPALDEPLGGVAAARVRRSFLPRPPRTESLKGWVCEYRWPLRILAEAVLLVWLIAFVVYQSSCRMRQVGLPFQLGLLLGAIVFLVLGGLLLLGDPALAQVRQGNALLAVVLVALVATIAYHMLKPRVEKP
ncbi:putative Ig domain-containing protein [Luteibacter yeojuensis]|uniref:Uncharacterized protein n=1 Tax=Luteibacter yeojuensis TaxID=345309 RepID=A0A7X5TP53_9GAMM|nr:putative Ig domain-containing protein [Luteibacter yeojuensis]NID14690.1 hypothetical protein [Luteibacter yeojuensis]